MRRGGVGVFEYRRGVASFARFRGITNETRESDVFSAVVSRFVRGDGVYARAVVSRTGCEQRRRDCVGLV